MTPDEEGVVAGHQWLYDYTKALDPQKVNAFAGQFAANISVPEEQDLFVTQRVAFADHRRLVPQHDGQVRARRSTTASTFIPVPEEGAESATWAGGWSMVIPQGAKNPERRLEVHAVHRRRAGTADLHHRSPRTCRRSRACSRTASLFEERHRFFAEQLLPTAKNRPPLPVGAKYWDELTIAWQKVYLNEEEPAAALATVKERVQPDLTALLPDRRRLRHRIGNRARSRDWHRPPRVTIRREGSGRAHDPASER